MNENVLIFCWCSGYIGLVAFMPDDKKFHFLPLSTACDTTDGGDGPLFLTSDDNTNDSAYSD